MLSYIAIIFVIIFLLLLIYYPVIFILISIYDFLAKTNYGTLDENIGKLDFKEKIKRNRLGIRYFRKEISKLQIIRFFTYLLMLITGIILFYFPLYLFSTLITLNKVLLVLFVIFFISMFDIKYRETFNTFLEEYTKGATHNIEILNKNIDCTKLEIIAFREKRELTPFE